VEDTSQFGTDKYWLTSCTSLLLVDAWLVLGFMLAFWRLYDIHDTPRSGAAWSFTRKIVELLLVILCIVNAILPLTFFNDKADSFVATNEDDNGIIIDALVMTMTWAFIAIIIAYQQHFHISNSLVVYGWIHAGTVLVVIPMQAEIRQNVDFDDGDNYTNVTTTWAMMVVTSLFAIYSHYLTVYDKSRIRERNQGAMIAVMREQSESHGDLPELSVKYSKAGVSFKAGEQLWAKALYRGSLEFEEVQYTPILTDCPYKFGERKGDLRACTEGSAVNWLVAICVSPATSVDSLIKTLVGISHNLQNICEEENDGAWRQFKCLVICEGQPQEDVLEYMASIGLYDVDENGVIDKYAKSNLEPEEKVSMHVFEYTAQLQEDENFEAFF